MSDLHLEFGDMEVPKRVGDVLVLAGDIHIGTKAIPWINKCAEVFPHVIYILGNHEYYNYNIATLADNILNRGEYLYSDAKAKHYELLSENVHFLDNTFVDIEGVRFIGTTLWSKITTYAANQMNDFNLIRNTTYTFTGEDANTKHALAVKFIKSSINPSTPNVVVTHHCPSVKCINTGRYPDDSMNTGYYTDILEEMSEWPVSVWMCGHTHASFNFVEHGINVLGNCRGYAGYESNPEFDEEACYEIKV